MKYEYNHEYQTLVQLDDTGKVQMSMQIPEDDFTKVEFLFWHLVSDSMNKEFDRFIGDTK